MALTSNIKDRDWVSVRQATAKLGSGKLGHTASPTFAGLTLTGLTASRLMASDASKALVSSDLASWVTGTANEVDITDDGDGTITIGIVNPLIVAKGGTGVATLTDGGILLGSGTGAITPLAQATHGQLPIGSTGADPVLATLIGSTDRISITNGAGSITLDLAANTQTLLDAFNGTFLETIDFTISESGGTVTGSLERDGGGDLTQRFSDGYSTLDCTPAATINLTAYVGTDVVPVKVFVYILQSAKTTLVASNSDWPNTEHIKIANLVLRSAATTGTDGGALGNRNWNDHAQSADSQGHVTHIEERIRQEPTQWESGVALTLKDSGGSALGTGSSSTAVELVTSAGVAYQLHRHAFSAVDMYTTGTDVAHIVNQPTDEGGAYETTSDLVGDITHVVDGTAAGVVIGTNKYFNLVIWGVMNRTGEISQLMINLPTGQYSTEAAATTDESGLSVFDIPAAFKGTGFLVARLTFRLVAGSQWTYIAQEDLRGQVPPSTAGVSVSTTAHDLLSNLDFASAGHTGFQAQGDVLDDLNTLGAVTADGEFLVGTDAGALAWESGATARTSIGLGTGNSPQFTGIEVGHASDTTLTRASAGDVNIESNIIYRAGGTDVPIGDGGTGQSTAQAAIDALSAVSGATNEHVLTKDTASGNAIFKAVSGVSAHAILDGSVHTDSVADDVTRGSIIYGNSTPKWDELVVGAADTFLGSDGTDVSYRTAAQVMASLSGEATAAFDLNGQDLTNGGVLFLTEQAAAEADVAGKGQYWVKNDAPCTPWFTGDTGAPEFQIGGIDVRSDVSSADIDHTTLVMDGSWYDWDLSSIVPVGTRFVNLRVSYIDNTVAAYIQLRKNGYSNANTSSPFGVLVANQWHYGNAWVPCDSNRVIEYQFSEAFSACYFTVIAWMF